MKIKLEGRLVGDHIWTNTVYINDEKTLYEIDCYANPINGYQVNIYFKFNGFLFKEIETIDCTAHNQSVYDLSKAIVLSDLRNKKLYKI